MSDELNTQNEDKKPVRPLQAYAVVSQISFIILTPLLLFAWGGSWLVDKFEMPSFMKLIFVLLGVFTMIASLVNYLLKLIRLYGKTKADKYQKYRYDKRDHDFYDDNVKKRL